MRTNRKLALVLVCGCLLTLVAEVVPDWDAVTRIAVGVGPGGFTGLRIGIATARALSQARDLPLVGVSSLAALAAPVDGPVVAVIDARRGEVFAAGWVGSESFEPVALAPDALRDQKPAPCVSNGVKQVLQRGAQGRPRRTCCGRRSHA